MDPRCSWHVHVKSCGGEFVKTKEPEPKGKGKMGGTRKSKEEGGHALGGSEQTKVQAKKAKGSEGHLLSVSGPNVLGRGPTKKSKAGDGQVLGVGEGSQRRSILDFFDRTGG